MALARDIETSTTGQVTDWEIDKHIGVVTAHLVVGTNLFSDIVVSGSDVVGSRPKNYQEQLASLNEEVVRAACDFLREGKFEVRRRAVFAQFNDKRRYEPAYIDQLQMLRAQSESGRRDSLGERNATCQGGGGCTLTIASPYWA